jgi:lysophospholipase L1-like esterase
MVEPTQTVEQVDSADLGRTAFYVRAGQIALTVICILVAAEGITRVADLFINDVPLIGLDEDSVLYSEHPYIYKVPQPNARFDKYEVNSHGFRGRAFTLPKPDNTYRILTVGGSSTWDSNVSGTDQTWSAQLEDLLNEDSQQGGRRYEVVNGGVPGHNSAESVMNFMWRGLPIQPDAVVIYQGYNDYKANRFPGFRSDYAHFRTRDHTILRALSKKIRLIYHLRRFVTKKKPKTIQKEDAVTEPGILAFTDNLRKITTLARSRGIQPIFTTFAMPVTEANLASHRHKFRGMDKYLATLTMDGARDAHARYNGAIRALGKELSVSVVDVDAAIPKDFDHFTDHTHFTDKGSARMAAALQRPIREAAATQLKTR